MRILNDWVVYSESEHRLHHVNVGDGLFLAFGCFSSMAAQLLLGLVALVPFKAEVTSVERAQIKWSISAWESVLGGSPLDSLMWSKSISKVYGSCLWAVPSHCLSWSSWSLRIGGKAWVVATHQWYHQVGDITDVCCNRG